MKHLLESKAGKLPIIQHGDRLICHKRRPQKAHPRTHTAAELNSKAKRTAADGVLIALIAMRGLGTPIIAAYRQTSTQLCAHSGQHELNRVS